MFKYFVAVVIALRLKVAVPRPHCCLCAAELGRSLAGKTP